MCPFAYKIVAESRNIDPANQVKKIDKANMNRYISRETTNIFFFCRTFIFTGYGYVCVMVDFISMGLLMQRWTGNKRKSRNDKFLPTAGLELTTVGFGRHSRNHKAIRFLSLLPHQSILSKFAVTKFILQINALTRYVCQSWLSKCPSKKRKTGQLDRSNSYVLYFVFLHICHVISKLIRNGFCYALGQLCQHISGK